jgi:hypothetical protein
LRRRSLRLALKFSVLANLALFALLWWDWSANASRLWLPLLVAYGIFLAATVLLFFSRPQPKAQPPEDPEPIGDQPARLAIAQRP